MMRYRLARWLAGGPFMRLPTADKESVYIVMVFDYGRSNFAVAAKTLHLNLTTEFGKGRSGRFEGEV